MDLSGINKKQTNVADLLGWVEGADKRLAEEIKAKQKGKDLSTKRFKRKPAETGEGGQEDEEDDIPLQERTKVRKIQRQDGASNDKQDAQSGRSAVAHARRQQLAAAEEAKAAKASEAKAAKEA
jgi:hypothetical protein